MAKKPIPASSDIHLDCSLSFRIDYEAQLNGRTIKGEETEANWYYVDQRGRLFSSGPMMPITPVCNPPYTKVVAKVKIGEEWLTIEEIEKRIQPKEANND